LCSSSLLVHSPSRLGTRLGPRLATCTTRQCICAPPAPPSALAHGPEPRRRVLISEPRRPTSLDTDGASRTGARLSSRSKKVQDALGAGRECSTAAGQQVRPRPPHLLPLATSPSSPRTGQRLETPLLRDDELTRAPRVQIDLAERADGRVGRCTSWRSTSSGSSRSLCVPPALSTCAIGSSMHCCAYGNCALTSFTVCAGQSSPRWHPLPFSSRKLGLSLAGRLSPAPFDAHRVSRESCWAQAAERCPSRRPYSSRRLREPSRRGRVSTRLRPPSRAPEGSGCTLVCRSHGHLLITGGDCAPSLNCYLLIQRGYGLLRARDRTRTSLRCNRALLLTLLVL